MIFTQLLVVTILFLFNCSNGFRPSGSISSKSVRGLRMEYVPDGLTKQQWEAIKKKEAEELKEKGNLGVVGTTKFKSRSFEAWQKSGAKHLFPVNPLTASYEERPYMQRKSGDWEGKDLSKLGLEGRDQGEPAKRVMIDNLYDDYEDQGKLKSFSFFGGAPLPWTSEAAAKLSNKAKESSVVKTGEQGVAGKKLSPEKMEKLKSTLAKPVISSKSVSAPVVEAPKPAEGKKKLFGMF